MNDRDRPTVSAAPEAPLARSALRLLASLTLTMTAACQPLHAEQVRLVPPPAADEDVAAAGATEVTVLAGGCFWGVQGVFQHLKGVKSAVSGYAGGDRTTADYERVSSGGTGHAESVQVTFDPKQVSFGRILQVYFSVVHDPTQLNRQGPDTGTQYRSAIFAQTPEQASLAKAYIAQLNAARVFDAAIVTRVEPNKPFFQAEGYHQDYLTRYPSNPYIAYNDIPKVAALQRLFPERYQAEPVLVLAKR